MWRRFRALLLLALALTLGLAACGDDDDDDGEASGATTTTTAGGDDVDGFVVSAGMNDPDDPNIAVTEFLPAEIAVPVGTEVTWEWNGAEPHSVTFAADNALPPPGPPDEELFAPTPPTGPVDGKTLVNSGLVPLGPTAPEPFELSFDTAGSYPYFCVIHPGMTGTVEVVDDDADADTPEEVAERGEEEADGWLAEGRAAKEKLVSAEPAKTMEGGKTVWTVKMGTTTEHTDVLAFAPTPAKLKVGDSVRFLNDSGAPHTATFFGEGAEPIRDPTDERTAEPAPGPSPQALSSKGLLNTGELPPNSPPGAGPPEQARSFVFTAPTAGTFGFVCILHAPSQMVGSIVVT